MQSDGNLVVYNSGDHPVFATGTNRHPTDYAVLPPTRVVRLRTT
jgi:hypothetical protein